MNWGSLAGWGTGFSLHHCIKIGSGKEREITWSRKLITPASGAEAINT
jgi:hypothetical protein